MSKLVIGLTGGIGSGKTTVTDYFQELGIEVIDADIIAREVVALGSPALTAISQHFGADYIQQDGQLNRSLLRNRIFANEPDKLWLNELLHPLIRSSLLSQTKKATSPYCILVAPLLIENNLQHLVNRVLVIDVSESTQTKRTMQRDNNSIAQVKAILASQTTRANRLNHADDIITNDDVSLACIKEAVTSLDKKYLALTKML
ncbi:dephospho-CoA kinase [Colwellia piezophila]|uniref:dephospho-CoA kinase n=1 Tax=Colwellia piezophila TaxID=211668 RepID=UPI000364DE41|nr:dephospho-CoA kinase [Colwellia piezophila]